MKRIYLDNAASTQLLPEVLDGITNVLKSHHANPSSIHAQGRQSRTIIEKARKSIANHLHCSIGEIFFTSGATEGNNTILTGAVRDLGIDHIIYAPIEHPSVMKVIENIGDKGEVSIFELGVDSFGNINIEELETEIKIAQERNRKILVSIMYVNNEIGTIQVLSEIANLCKNQDVLLHTDAVQAIGKYPIDLNQMSISFLTCSAHKFHGPKGVGFFYMNGDHIINPMIYGGAQERNMRSGTENTAYIHGMEIALNLALEDIEKRKDYISNLRSIFIDELKKRIPSVEILGNTKDDIQQYCICNVSFAPHLRNEMLMMNLDIAGISASGGSACSSGIEYTSHVMKAIKLDRDRTVIRFSFSHLNTKDEIEYLLSVLEDLQK